MQKTLVKYRTSDYQYNQYAVIPTLYLSDILQWLKLSEHSEIVSVTHNYDGPITLPKLKIVIDWATAMAQL